MQMALHKRPKSGQQCLKTVLKKIFTSPEGLPKQQSEELRQERAAQSYVSNLEIKTIKIKIYVESWRRMSRVRRMPHSNNRRTLVSDLLLGFPSGKNSLREFFLQAAPQRPPTGYPVVFGVSNPSLEQMLAVLAFASSSPKIKKPTKTLWAFLFGGG
jgi:hypothetical protein